MHKIYPARPTERTIYNGRCVLFKSGIEAAVAEYLDLLIRGKAIIGYDYEPRTFIFEAEKWRHRRYRPDFRVDVSDTDHYWIEVKGHLDAPSVTKLRRFARYYPEERLELWMDGLPAGRTSKSKAALRRLERVMPFVSRVVNARVILRKAGLR